MSCFQIFVCSVCNFYSEILLNQINSQKFTKILSMPSMYKVVDNKYLCHMSNWTPVRNLVWETPGGAIIYSCTHSMYYVL